MYFDDKDVFLISGEINRQCFITFSQSLNSIQNKKPQAVLFLSTYGGEPGAGYRITRLLQHSYSHIRFVIPYMCKSTGTLMAIGANELAMSDLSEFGPLDIQVRRNDEFYEHSSGLDLVESMNFINEQMRKSFAETLVDIKMGSRLTTKLCGDFATKISSSIAEPLYSQIDPQRLGELQRAMKITSQYGSRLRKRSQSISEEGLSRLVTSYPEHGFVIDKEEAKELFSTVTNTNEQEEVIINLFNGIFMNPSQQIVLPITLEVLRDCNGYERISKSFDESSDAYTSSKQQRKEHRKDTKTKQPSKPIPSEQQSLEQQDSTTEESSPN